MDVISMVNQVCFIAGLMLSKAPLPNCLLLLMAAGQ
jgi:hypothetical protein